MIFPLFKPRAWKIRNLISLATKPRHKVQFWFLVRDRMLFRQNAIVQSTLYVRWRVQNWILKQGKKKNKITLYEYRICFVSWEALDFLNFFFMYWIYSLSFFHVYTYSLTVDCRYGRLVASGTFNLYISYHKSQSSYPSLLCIYMLFCFSLSAWACSEKFLTPRLLR